MYHPIITSLKMQPNSAESGPAILRKLKGQLANNSCVCANVKNQETRNQEVQMIGCSNSSADEDIQVNEENPVATGNSVILQSLFKDVLCPKCFINMSLLRGGTIKIVKDEAVDVQPYSLCADKSVENHVDILEKSTSHHGTVADVINSILLTENKSEDSCPGEVRPKESKVTFNNKVDLIEEIESSLQFKDLSPRNSPPCCPKGKDCTCLEKYLFRYSNSFEIN